MIPLTFIFHCIVQTSLFLSLMPCIRKGGFWCILLFLSSCFFILPFSLLSLFNFRALLLALHVFFLLFFVFQFLCFILLYSKISRQLHKTLTTTVYIYIYFALPFFGLEISHFLFIRNTIFIFSLYRIFLNLVYSRVIGNITRLLALLSLQTLQRRVPPDYAWPYFLCLPSKIASILLSYI